MATTDTDLYRSVMGNGFKSVKVGTYPGDGILYPRWESTQYFNKKRNQMVTSQADLTVADGGARGPEVLPDGGTSLHDVSGWFPVKEFWIPEGTEYSSELINIRKDSKQKTSPTNPKLKGHHYQLEPKTRMTVLAFKGALDNMARAAVVRQCEMAGI